jgi:cell division protein FtsW
MNDKINQIIKGDKIIIIVIIALLLISALMLGSTSTSLALKNGDFSFQYLFRQIGFAVVAFFIMTVTSYVHYNKYAKIAKPLYIIAVSLMIITIIAGVSINSAKRWLPFMGFTIQTSDFVRIALIIMVAKIISQYDPKKGNMEDMMDKVSWWTIPVAVLIAVYDLSTAILVLITVYTMVLLTSIEIKIFLKKILILGAIAIAALAIVMMLHIGRANTWLNRFKQTKTEKIYGQKTQSQIAIANAHLIPKPGSSTQKYLLANSYSDYVFAIAVEEYGIIGAIIIIMLYIILLYRISLIIKRQKRTFPLYLSIGISLNILTQAFVHILVNVGILPVTGQPLPFVSMGGSAILSAAIQVGILLNISEKTLKQKNISDNKTEKENDVIIDDHPFLIG